MFQRHWTASTESAFGAFGGITRGWSRRTIACGNFRDAVGRKATTDRMSADPTVAPRGHVRRELPYTAHFMNFSSDGLKFESCRGRFVMSQCQQGVNRTRGHTIGTNEATIGS